MPGNRSRNLLLLCRSNVLLCSYQYEDVTGGFQGTYRVHEGKPEESNLGRQLLDSLEHGILRRRSTCRRAFLNCLGDAADQVDTLNVNIPEFLRHS